MNRLFAIVVSLLTIAAPLAADENRPNGRQPGQARHYIVSTTHVLSAAEQEELAADGVEVQHVLPHQRYLVRAAGNATLSANPNFRSIEPFGATQKMWPAAMRIAATTHPYVTINVVFQDDATLDDARAAVEAAGGTVDTLLPLDAAPQRLQVRIPPQAILRLAADERVFGIYGPPLKAKADNSVAADMSHATPLFSSPYDLDGTGVVVSMHEPTDSGRSSVDVAHPEFGGRVTLHDTDNIAGHGTHVAGTILAAGINPLAKGMAPNATMHMYNLSGNDVSITQKGSTLPALGVISNNNSWGFQLGWQQDASGGWVWFGATQYYGAYDGFYSAPYDKVARLTAPNVLFVHSSGNDGDNGNPGLGSSTAHKHVDDNFDIVTNETFCYSPSGNGGDCAVGCSTGISTKVHDDDGNPVPHCETVKHPIYGPYNTHSFIASEKNIVSVGAITSISTPAGFSSRGPALDGRVKPDLVALGVNQFSTLPSNQYGNESGTSMSSPVVTGIAALVVQQWRKTFGGQTPTAQQVKTLLIAGARDRVGPIESDLPGPDYTFGFGLVDAQNSVDLIRADGATGLRIRTDAITQGQTVDIPMTVTTTGNLRVVAGWADPEVLLGKDDFANNTLVNDIDLKVLDPSGATVLPYVLDKNNPSAAATRGVNSVDNTEEVEIANAQPGVYHVVLTGKNIPIAPQTYVLVANGNLGQSAPPCGDVYEPNDTPATAFSFILTGQRVTARICAANDVDYYNMQVSAPGPLTISIAATDTPLKATLSYFGGSGIITPASVTLAAGQTQSITTTVTSPTTYTLKVEANGTVGSDAHYTFTPTFGISLGTHGRTARH